MNSYLYKYNKYKYKYLNLLNGGVKNKQSSNIDDSRYINSINISFLDSIPSYILSNILEYDNYIESLSRLRLVSSNIEKLIKELPICNMKNIIMNFTKWKNAYPNAICANLFKNIQITDNDFRYYNKLEKLNISGCMQITNMAFDFIFNLKELYMSDCILITNSVISKFNLLEKLNISGCTQITDDAFENIDKLKELNMSRCLLIGNSVISKNRSLQKLYISDCMQITDDAFENIDKLKELNMSGCNNITDNIFNKLKSLEKLEIINWNNINANQEILLNLPKLISLTLINIPNLYRLYISKCSKLKHLIIESNYLLREIEARNIQFDSIEIGNLPQLTTIIAGSGNILKKIGDDLLQFRNFSRMADY